MSLYNIPPPPRTSDQKEIDKWREAVKVAVNSLFNIKSGTDQADAGAIAGELWVDSSTNIVHRGV